MTFNNIILLLLMLILADKVLNRVLKNTEKIKSKKINNFNLYSNEDFHMLVKRYINSLGYSNLVEKQKGEMMVYNNEGVALIGYRQVEKLDEDISKDEIMNFVASMNLKSASKGYFLTNGNISKGIKDMLKATSNERFQITFVDGADLLVEFNKIKLQQIKSEVDDGEVAF